MRLVNDISIDKLKLNSAILKNTTFPSNSKTKEVLANSGNFSLLQVGTLNVNSQLSSVTVNTNSNGAVASQGTFINELELTRGVEINFLESKTLISNKVDIIDLQASSIEFKNNSVVGLDIFLEKNLKSTDLNSKTSNLNTFSTDNLTVPSIHINKATTGTVNTQNTSVAGVSNVTNSTVDTINAKTVGSQNLTVTGPTKISNSFIYNDTGKEKFYTSPSEGAFRGLCFFQGLDIGIQSTGTLISMKMTTSNRQPYLSGYSPFLGAIDNTTTLGGSKAILSISAPTATSHALRWQEDGNLCIYSGNTKIWQNGNMVSDARLKCDIMPIKSAMEIIMKIDGVTFDYNFPPFEKSVGVILENVKEVFPECVTDNLVHLENLVPLLLEGFKELKARNVQILALTRGTVSA